MRVELSVTSVSWIPSEAISGLPKAGFLSGVLHYDDPPPDRIESLAALHEAERFRFANRLAAWVDVEDGEVVDGGYSGRGYITRTRAGLGKAEVAFEPAEFPELRAEPERESSHATFVQTCGGRTGMPFPRPVKRKPFLQWASPTVWTTLRLTVGADGSSTGELIGASDFPRHWVYDDTGQLVAKAGLASFQKWQQGAFGRHSPWGNEDSQPLVTLAESALERQLSTTIMRGGAKPKIRKVRQDALLAEQGQPGDELYLLLDGVLSVSVDDDPVGELGPGAVIGERAALEGGRRTATLRARHGLCCCRRRGRADRSRQPPASGGAASPRGPNRVDPRAGRHAGPRGCARRRGRDEETVPMTEQRAPSDPGVPSEFGDWGPAVSVRIDRSAVWAFARAVCDDNSRYAAVEGAPDGAVPPTFSFAWLYSCALASPSGAVPSLMPPGADLFRRGAAPNGVFLHGEQSFTFHRPAHVGEVLEGRMRVGQPVEKPSRQGTMVMTRVQTQWSADGEPVVTDEATYILLLAD